MTQDNNTYKTTADIRARNSKDGHQIFTAGFGIDD